MFIAIMHETKVKMLSVDISDNIYINVLIPNNNTNIKNIRRGVKFMS